MNGQPAESSMLVGRSHVTVRKTGYRSLDITIYICRVTLEFWITIMHGKVVVHLSEIWPCASMHGMLGIKLSETWHWASAL